MPKRNAALALGLSLLLLGSAACHHNKGPKAKGPTEILTVEQLWARGDAALKKGHTATSRKYFDQIILREDAGEYKDRAALATADSYYREHNIEAYAEAISRYQTFLSFHPTHPEAPFCQYRIALCYLEEVETPDRDTTPAVRAQEAFRSLVDNYPSSTYVEDSKKKLAQVNDILAAHEIKVGDHYLRTGGYRGAIARYRTVVDKYPGYWNMPLVYFRLGEALSRDGQDEEARLYFTRIVQEQGSAQLAKEARRRLDQIGRRDAKETERQDKKAVPEGPLVQPKQKGGHWWQFWKWGKKTPT